MEIIRSIFNKLEAELPNRAVSILLGARQVGKSTLMEQLQRSARKKGLSTVYYNLELSSDLEKFSGDAKGIYHLLTSGAEVVFIDEFHYLENASKIFKSVYDGKKRVKIFASGSSSLEIHKHLRESLAGRFQKTMIYPLSYEECGQIQEFNLDQYLRWGGMPGLLHSPGPEEKINLLENIVSTYLTKDIKALIQEENVRAFNSLLYLLAQNQGSLATHSNLAREIGLSEPTIVRHLEIMSQTYVCFSVPSFSTNLANELKKSRKYYLFDLGIRNQLLKDFRTAAERDDKGVLHESFVLQQLVPQLKPNMEIRFWRTKKGEEVDFILLKNRVPIPIEVKSALKGPEIPSGLLQFMKRYPRAPFGIVFSENFKGESALDHRKIHFKTLPEVMNLDMLQSPL
ncbi:ATP-binding protein [bacterium]|nr:MAG: ATP-binding protein [bacterium]